MTEDLDKTAKIEGQKTFRTALWFLALLIVAAILFGIYRVVTAPVRIAQDTTETITRGIEKRATAVLTNRHIGVAEGRRFSRLSDTAHATFIALPETKPDSIGERTFRMANLRGSQGKVCTFTMEFGGGPVVIWTAADNADFETNRSLGGEAERQLRIVWQMPDYVLGVSVQYAAQYKSDDDAPSWELLWRRRNSVNEPLTDATIGERTMNVLQAIPEECGTPAP